MRLVRSALTAAAAFTLIATPFAAAVSTPRATLKSAPLVKLPGEVDSNSPVMWDVEGGRQQMYVFTSHSGVAKVSQGTGFDLMSEPDPIELTPYPGYGVWMEAVVSDDVETWYGYYHNEWPASRCGRDDRFVPRIGAAKSSDHGRTWQDLGVVLQARQATTACESTNRYVIGGDGDLSVMLDRDKNFLYFFYSQYAERAESQGVGVARMAWADRDRPSGNLEIWRDGIWDEGARRRELLPGLPGTERRMLEWTYLSATPLVAPSEPWHDGDDKVDAFWGPSVHWNTLLEQYVMLLNRAKDESYTQEGIYVSYAPRLDDPSLWTKPEKILSGGRWYPQVIGVTPGVGTDKTAAGTPRFFMSGKSEWVLNFSK